MGRKYQMSTLLCLVLAGGVYAEVNTPRVPDHTLPHMPTPPGEALSREGVLWVEGAMLSSPCASGRAMTGSLQDGVVKTQPQSVVVLLEGCGDGTNGGGARLPVTIDVTPGLPLQVSQPRSYRLAHGNSTLPLTVQPGTQVLRVEMNYE
ncbi:hypothetical protein [Serratia marcescens]|uniref:hypothetical protein n=1 Tax=Serratia marcescens TaxID=615 RepID=UPI000CDAC540|nr:hypothetical protein [Serratia marcescens]POP23635.1 hypothetical protein C3R39_09270 [Serratia marcescens]POP28293.1 hypothetical protein C3R43_13085 [Serratia marcescens]WLS88713.1 hypothetical protein RAM09_04510 [Serratia marcescens]